MSWFSKAIGWDKSKKNNTGVFSWDDAWEESKEDGTGVFSWGNSEWARSVADSLPVLGDVANWGLDALSESSAGAQARKATRASLLAKRFMHVGT